MKAKLLKRLRKRFPICVRNKEYKVIDNTSHGSNKSITDWISKEEALCARRKIILEVAQAYKIIKKTYL